ncbi:uncharacterized protein VNE69_11094 [Vairimorpha necatrix]|uniref:Membrane protein n=1 Tax=Vairimorpha necatrix TaxID=6039 RepID=A0AAX4JGC8_9MICR
MNLHSKKNSLYSLLIALLFIFTLFIITEYAFDYSIISASYLISFSILGLLAFSLIYAGVCRSPFSFLVSILTLITCFILGLILLLMRHTVGYEIISEFDAVNLLDARIDNDVGKTKKKTREWTSKQSISVLFYEQKQYVSDEQDKLLSSEDLIDLKKNFLKSIYDACNNRKSESDPAIASLYNEIRSKKNLQNYIKILNSIQWSRFPKNLVILIEILEPKDVVANGFNRNVINHS